MTWAQMEFDHEEHPHTGIMLIGASEELIETLEDNQASIVYNIWCERFFFQSPHYQCSILTSLLSVCLFVHAMLRMSFSHLCLGYLTPSFRLGQGLIRLIDGCYVLLLRAPVCLVFHARVSLEATV